MWSPQLKGETFELVLRSRISSIKSILCVDNIVLYSPHLKKLTEIDLLAIAPWGVYCLEAKAYTTSLSGKASEERWLGVSNRRTTYLFNPIIQNFEHIRALKHNLIVDGLKLDNVQNSVVVPDTCDIAGSDMKYSIIKTISDFTQDLILDMRTLPHNVNAELIFDRVCKIRDLYGGVKNGRF